MQAPSVVTVGGNPQQDMPAADSRASVDTHDVVLEHELPVSIVLPTGKENPGATVARDVIACDLEPVGENRRAVRWSKIDTDSGARALQNRVADRVDVEHGLAAVGRTHVKPCSACAGDRVVLDAKADRA